MAKRDGKWRRQYKAGKFIMFHTKPLKNRRFVVHKVEKVSFMNITVSTCERSYDPTVDMCIMQKATFWTICLLYLLIYNTFWAERVLQGVFTFFLGLLARVFVPCLFYLKMSVIICELWSHLLGCSVWGRLENRLQAVVSECLWRGIGELWTMWKKTLENRTLFNFCTVYVNAELEPTS